MQRTASLFILDILDLVCLDTQCGTRVVKFRLCGEMFQTGLQRYIGVGRTIMPPLPLITI